MVFATPEDGIATAVQGVNQACNSARAAGYRCRTLIGGQATVAAYRAYLRHCPRLKAFGNIGHGNPQGILLHNHEVLDFNWFNSLPNTGLNNKVSYFNSCKVHNPPLETSIMNAGARTYIGGNVNLGIGTSEEVFKCFWQDALVNKKAMKPSVVDCEQNNYPSTGAHGLSGAEGSFTALIMRRPERLQRRPERIEPRLRRLQPVPIQ
jgi:hypothetical protein